jgi:hypothetical protein
MPRRRTVARATWGAKVERAATPNGGALQIAIFGIGGGFFLELQR